MVTFIRVGSTSRVATRQEEGRLYQSARLVRYEIKAVPDTGPESFDWDRIENYYRNVRKRTVPDRTEVEAWRRILLNSDLTVLAGDDGVASVAGLLLFGKQPSRRLPQAGMTAVAFPGTEKTYETIDEERIRGPLTPPPLVSRRGGTRERGAIDTAIDFVKRNMGSSAWLEGGRRRRKRALPMDAVREAIVNAVVHRDYTREGVDIEVSLYQDRVEIISPGRLPNGVTVPKMEEGIVRAARNGFLKDILSDYRYIEHYGMGVRTRILESVLQHTGVKPDLIEGEDRFVVRLWKRP